MTEWTVNGWIEHDGKGMPVAGDTIVSVRTRDEVSSGPCPAHEFFGRGKGVGGDWWTHQGE